MGKKQQRKESKKVLRVLKAHLKKNKGSVLKKGYKEKCCKSYRKSASKRCGRCPCYDLLKQVA